MRKSFAKSPVPGKEHIVEVVAVEMVPHMDGPKEVITRTLGHYDARMKVLSLWETAYVDYEFWKRLLAFVSDNYPDNISDYPVDKRKDQAKERKAKGRHREKKESN